MIFRVPDPQNVTTNSALSTSPSPPVQRLQRQQQSTISETSDDIDVVTSNTQVSNSTFNNKVALSPDNERPNLSYIETADDPFEEIVIRAETFFPGLRNIAGETDHTFEPTTRKLTVKNSRNRPNSRSALSIEAAENKRRAEQEIDKRVMSYSQAMRNPHGYCLQQPSQQMQHPMHYSQQPQLQPQASLMHYGGYYAQPVPSQPMPPPLSQRQSSMNEPDQEPERTTYDHRNFQAARQRFEQNSIMSQSALAPPRNHLSRPMLRHQHSITSTVVSMGASFYNPSGPPPQPPMPQIQHKPPPPSAPPPFMSQMSTTDMVSSGQEEMLDPMSSGAIVRREPRKFGCGCGPGAGCGALPEAPIENGKSIDREMIKKYLVAEEMGPGGVRSVFNFPDGVEPSDLTLLRAAIAANAPKDSFIPEENDDLEEQLNIQLQNACPEFEATQAAPPSPEPQIQQQLPQHPNRFQTAWRNGGANMMTLGPATASVTPHRPSILKQHQPEQFQHQRQQQQHHQQHHQQQHHQQQHYPQQQQQQQQQPGQPGQPLSSGDNPLNALMFNGLGNYAVGPNSPQYRGCQMGQAQPQHQPGNPHVYTTYNSSRFDALPTNHQGQQPQPQPINGEYHNGTPRFLM